MFIILNLRVFISDYTRIHNVVGIKNTHFQSSKRNNQTLRIKKNPLQRAISKYAPVHWFWEDGRLIRINKKYAVSNVSGFVWTGPLCKINTQ